VSVSNTFPWTLHALAEQFGGSVRVVSSRNPRARRHYQWTVCGDQARAVCRATLPLLREKRRQAEILLLAHRYPARSAMRAALLRELKHLKRIVYA